VNSIVLSHREREGDWTERDVKREDAKRSKSLIWGKVMDKGIRSREEER